jgi:hypothetical protein
MEGAIRRPHECLDDPHLHDQAGGFEVGRLRGWPSTQTPATKALPVLAAGVTVTRA